MILGKLLKNSYTQFYACTDTQQFQCDVAPDCFTLFFLSFVLTLAGDFYRRGFVGEGRSGWVHGLVSRKIPPAY
jgi:hypothetical protein